MSFLKRHEKQEDASQSGDNEELYEKLFPKIGRDYVYREDFEEVIQQILILLASIQPIPVTAPIDFRSDAKARLKAAEYKDLIESGRDGSKIYRDLIKIDEPELEEQDRGEI